MARPSSKDPLDKFRWTVSIVSGGTETFTRLGFSSVETPEVNINVRSYPEGGNHLFPKQIIDTIQYKPVTLLRGVTSDLNFHEWAIQFIELVNGQRDRSRLGNTAGPQLPPGDYRRDVIIEHKDRAGRTVKRYVLHNAFPIEYKPASNFSADADDMLSMEKLVLAYESFSIETTSTDTNPFSIKDITKRLLRRAF